MSLLELTRTTHGTASGVVLLREEAGYRAQSGGSKPSALLSEGAPLMTWLSTTRQVFITDEQEAQLDPLTFATIRSELVLLEGELAAPISYQGKLLGVLVLGSKKDREAFFQKDVDFLETVTTAGAVALANAKLTVELPTTPPSMRLAAS